MHRAPFSPVSGGAGGAKTDGRRGWQGAEEGGGGGLAGTHGCPATGSSCHLRCASGGRPRRGRARCQQHGQPCPLGAQTWNGRALCLPTQSPLAPACNSAEIIASYRLSSSVEPAQVPVQRAQACASRQQTSRLTALLPRHRRVPSSASPGMARSAMRRPAVRLLMICITFPGCVERSGTRIAVGPSAHPPHAAQCSVARLRWACVAAEPRCAHGVRVR